MKSYLIPPKPHLDMEHHSEMPEQEASEDPQLAVLRESIEKEPQNLEKLKMLAGMLGDKLRENPGVGGPVVFEAIDVLSRILAIEPNDPGALVMMADVSFDQRAFTKAKEFYEKYLKLEPTNLGARSRYASALTFLGEYDNSIKELDSVLKEDPKNFPAMAYLAITYAQRGDLGKAKELGTTALSLAPSDEARARFSAFVTSLNGDGAAGSSAPSASQPSPATVPAQSGIEGFSAMIKANPVAGPKFARAELGKSGEMKVFFRNFPMGQMPPFAKEKFFGTVRAAINSAKLEGVSKISFIDDATGATMEEIPVAK